MNEVRHGQVLLVGMFQVLVRFVADCRRVSECLAVDCQILQSTEATVKATCSRLLSAANMGVFHDEDCTIVLLK